MGEGTMNPKELAELCLLHGAMQKPEEVELLCRFLKGRAAEVVLEIGTGRGGTLWLWSHLEGNKCVISIDLWGGAFGGGPSEDDMARIENWVDREKETYVNNRDSHKTETLEEVKEALAGRQLDILFIDGDHTYEGCRQDFEMYSPLVKPGGVIVFHDILEHPTELNCHVDKVWTELTPKYEAHEFCVTDSGGAFNTMPFISVQKTDKPWGGIGAIVWPIL
jgi:predicted O-methyltransferase YrrM